jgi:hypothetical protein
MGALIGASAFTALQPSGYTRANLLFGDEDLDPVVSTL